MISDIKMPASGQNAAESTIVAWHVQLGDEVDRGDVLFDIETDKATMSIESYAKGTVLEVLYAEGEKVEAGKVVARIGEKGEVPAKEEYQPTVKSGDLDDEYQPILKGSGQTQKKAEKNAISQAQALGSLSNSKSVVMASPAARKTAKDRGVDIAAVYTTLGKVVKEEDVLAWRENDAQSEYISVKPTSMRKTIAHRMLQSTAEAPQFTVTIKPDITALIELRKNINTALEKENVKVSYNDLLAKCVCSAVEKVPYINSIYADDEIRLLKNVNVGIAVGLTDGLVVPVVRSVNVLSIKETAKKSKELIEKAKSGKIESGDMQGGTITISNLGMYGINNFTALVNRPESAILAVGSIVETPVGLNGEIVLRPIMDITAAFDHRIIDGSVGAQFMAELKKFIEQPLMMI